MPRPKATHCPQGHAYDEENTYMYRGSQHCKECRRGHVRKWSKANPEAKARTQRANPEARRDASRNWAQANPDKRRAALVRRYGITVEQYNVMYEAQAGRCAVCGGTDSGDPRFNTLHIDHDHKTGAVRGLLCSRCNRGMGSFSDDPDRLLAAAAYLLRNTDLLKGAL